MGSDSCASNDFSHGPAAKKRIGIIGGGIAGLAAARRFKQAGHDVTIFERNSVIGGVWATAYDSAKLQNIGTQYQFPDFPFPFPVDYHPTKHQILAYLNAFIERFDLSPHIRLNCNIISLCKHADGRPGWSFILKSGETETFDHAVVCEGHFSVDPIIPEVANQKTFNGLVMHEREIRDESVFRDKKSVIVGFGKTAMDLAMISKDIAKRTHMIVRQPRWPLPEYMLGVHYRFLVFNRIHSSMMPCWYHLPGEGLLHRLGIPNLFWKLIEVVVHYTCGWKTNDPLRPSSRIQDELRAATPLVPEHFYQHCRSNAIEVHPHTTLASMTKNSVVLSNGETIEADLVVFATGHKSTFPWLPAEYSHLVDHDGIHLYRHLVHPDMPDMTFIGFNQSFLSFASMDLGLLWVLASWEGKLRLPAPEAQRKSIAQQRAWKAKHAGYEPARAACVGTRFQQYHDELCGDLGVSPLRKMARWGWWNPIGMVLELLQPYYPADYNGLYPAVLGADGRFIASPSQWKIRPSTI